MNALWFWGSERMQDPRCSVQYMTCIVDSVKRINAVCLQIRRLRFHAGKTKHWKVMTLIIREHMYPIVVLARSVAPPIYGRWDSGMAGWLLEDGQH